MYEVNLNLYITNNKFKSAMQREFNNLDPSVFCGDSLKALSCQDKRRWDRGWDFADLILASLVIKCLTTNVLFNSKTSPEFYISKTVKEHYFTWKTKSIHNKPEYS